MQKKLLLLSLLVTIVAAPLLAAAVGAGGRGQPLPGQIVIDPDNPRWLKRHGGDHVFICGPGDPEEFLYRGTRRPDGTRDGDQVALIRKLVEHGGNSIYLQAVRTHGGDARPDRTHNPFLDSDPAKGLDDRILAQWEEWFALMDAHDILIYFFFYDDSARIWNTGDEVGPEERAFFEAIVRRFKHHRNLIWIVGEELEERYTAARANALAGIIREADDHGHIIGGHHHSGTTFKFWRPGSAMTHYSMQLTAKEDAAHAGAVEALAKAQGRYQVIYSESTAMPTDGDGMRRHAWSVAMGGVMPMMLRMDIAGTAPETLRQCRILQRFFEQARFHTLGPRDELAYAETKYVLAAPAGSYLAYGDQVASGLGLADLPAGRYAISWIDCQSGRQVDARQTIARPGGHVFPKPAGIGAECAAWIRDPTAIAATAGPPLVASQPQPSAPPAVNRAPVAQDQSLTTRFDTPLYVQLLFADEDGPGPYSYTIVSGPVHGTLTGDDNDRTYTPKPGFSGFDEFRWTVSDGEKQSRPATVRITVEPRRTADARAPPDAPPPARYFPPAESQGGWRMLERPEDIRRLGGADPDQLAALKQWLLESDKRNFAATVIRNGYIVLEVERGHSAKTDARRVASVSKAVCATVLAIASERSRHGLTPHRMSFDDPAFPFIPWARPLSDPRKARITVRQLFNHTSGIVPEAIGAKNDGTWSYVLGHSGDPKTERLAFDPGEGCGYTTHAFHHASLVCEYVTGMPYDRFAIEHLFRPIGCEHWWFQYFDDAQIGRHPSHAMGMPARDLARIAYCMLRGGRWGGRQVIPRWFVDGIAEPATPRGYKEMRWGRDSAATAEAWELPMWLTDETAPGRGIVPADARFKRGSGGQFIAYVPSLDLVITRQTGGSGAWDYDEYLLRACEAVRTGS